ncbi:MAG TPA: N-6 DNA methylase, partial [Clostridia bacterium]|nr:N-6 DNA methylase [Clostridia bacterium]
RKIQYNRQELIKIFNDANNLLRGDGLRAGIERFGEFANILFLKLISENENIKRDQGAKSEFKNSCHWDTIKNIPSTARIDYINTTVYKELNNLFGTNIFTPLSLRSSDILSDIMKDLDDLTLTDVESDIKGDAFEYFLKESTATENDLGEYFTPRHIVKTMVKLLNPQIGEKTYDPFCGTGGFLIESFRHIHRTMPRNQRTEKMLREKTIYGNEITNTARITKMNMILAGDGHSNIQMRDSLANPEDSEYDIVITNMPYSQQTRYGNLYDLGINNGDSVCVQHCIKAIDRTSENGRMALVVPEGFLFRKALATTREYMYENCEIQSIISLPIGVFLPYTNVKTNIILANKVNRKLPRKDKRKSYWYFNVKSDGKTLDNYRRPMNAGNDLETYLEYRKLDETDRSNMLEVGFDTIPFNKIIDNDYVMIGSKYKDVNYYARQHKYVPLKDVAIVEIGNSAPQDANYFIDGTIPFVRVSDLAKYHRTTNLVEVEDRINEELTHNLKLFKKGTVVLPKSGMSTWLDHRGILGRDSYIASHLAAIFPKGEFVSSEYLYYVLSNIPSSSLILNESYPSIRKMDLENTMIPLLDKTEQEKLIDVLLNYQTIIDSANSIIKKYRPILPRSSDWDYKRIGDIATINPSRTSISSLKDDSLVSFVPMSTINENNIFFESNEVREKEKVYSGYTYFEEQDVLLAKITPSFENGKGGVAINLKQGIGFGSTELFVIRANKSLVLPEWIYYNLNSKEFLLNGEKAMTGTSGRQRVPKEFVENYLIPVPPLDEQDNIVKSLLAERDYINNNKLLIESLERKIKEVVTNLFD